MALTKTEQARQAQLDTLGKTYKAALYAQPRNETECLRLAEAMLLLCQGTHLEASALRTMKRHQGREE